MNSILALLVLCFCGVSSLSREAIHDEMTDVELEYYFQTNDKTELPDYEVVNLPFATVTDESIDYSFGAFNRPINLKLQRNSNLVSPNFTTHFVDGEYSEVLTNFPEKCHYIHKEDAIAAAISSCDMQSMQGLVFLEDSVLEIHPLTKRLQALLEDSSTEDLLDSTTIPHLVKRAKQFPHDDHIFANVLNTVEDTRETIGTRNIGPLTLELALFFDEAAYKIFAPFFGNDDLKLQDMILAYVNAVQALYYHSSLGTRIDLVLVRLYIMRKQVKSMPHYNGERSKLLDSFCTYQQSLNPKKDDDPHHWDMALYVSGLDFYAYENGRKSGATMGLATVGGVCLEQYNCVIAEMGTTNVFGKPYPSAGFTSVYILAHEIGHNLGMSHDSVGNSCPKEGYVMSPSRGTNGETQWSYCSAEVVSKLSWAKCLQDSAKPSRNLDHSKFLNNPGQVFTAKQQCEILLRDKDAVVSPQQELSTICYNLQCKTPHRSGYYFAGPALEGTECDNKKYCYGGNCVKKSLSKPVKTVFGGWGSWKESQCSSGCLEKSLGFKMKKRECNNPVPKNTDKGCEGSNIEFGTCKDDKLCGNKRLSVIDYAGQKCQQFSKVLTELDPKGGGLQAPHESSRIWVGCAIFCRHANSGGFYTPRIELNDLGLSPYFPDGTWCHREKSLNYYCLHHHCLPENFHLTKIDLLGGGISDVPFSQNAYPTLGIPPNVKNYFSLASDGKPLKTVFKPHEIDDPKDEEWESNDYVLLPNLK